MTPPSLRDALEQAILLSVGAASLTRDRVEQIVGELVAQGRVSAEDGRVHHGPTDRTGRRPPTAHTLRPHRPSGGRRCAARSRTPASSPATRWRTCGCTWPSSITGCVCSKGRRSPPPPPTRRRPATRRARPPSSPTGAAPNPARLMRERKAPPSACRYVTRECCGPQHRAMGNEKAGTRWPITPETPLPYDRPGGR